MKINVSILAALAAVAAVPVASAVTVDITGATAFRAAAVNAIKNSFTSVSYGWAGTGAFSAASQHIFVGTFPNIAGTTIVRTSWSGSTEGAKACIFGTPASYLPTTATVSTGGSPGASGSVSSSAARQYFSDVGFNSTVYSATAYTSTPPGIDALNEVSVGAVVFTPIKNKPSGFGASFTNITSKQFQGLFSPLNSGRAKLSYFTGLVADDGVNVYATGRNDFSGTRTDYLLESGFGATNLVNQWKITGFTATAATTVQLWPTGDLSGAVASSTDNRSLQWTKADGQITTAGYGYTQTGSEQPGNGGYGSGGTVSGVLKLTSTPVDVKNADGSGNVSGKNIVLVSWLDIPNALAATGTTGTGAVALKWNGVGITPATPLSPADQQLIQHGDYTAWTFERYNYVGDLSDLSSADVKVYNKVTLNLDATDIHNTGNLTLADMSDVIRGEDGGPLTISLAP